jgi:hypothetical protein
MTYAELVESASLFLMQINKFVLAGDPRVDKRHLTILPGVKYAAVNRGAVPRRMPSERNKPCNT